MFSFLRKHRIKIDIASVLVFGWGAVDRFYDYLGPEGKPVYLFGAIVFAILSIIRLFDVIAFFRKKRKVSES